jgi:pimeloyl-ACP methyl ester carboxylesterase
MNGWVAAGAVLLALVLAGCVYQAVGLARDARRFRPPGRFVDLAGRRLHVVCRGRGGPTVVLESAIGASSLSWAYVQPAVAGFATACAYDRAGLGWSDPAPAPRTFAGLLADLEGCLASLGRAEPLILVGHSFGVFVALAHAARHPGGVAGLVLVDPPTEWMQIDAAQAHMLRGGASLAGLGAWLARLGVVRASLALLTGGAPGAPRRFVRIFGPTAARTLERLVGEVRKLPPELHPIVQALWCQPKCFRALADHLRMLPQATTAALAAGTLGDVPTVVISSAAQPPAIKAAHDALARMSSGGRVVFASMSGHWVPYDEPELIVQAIHDVIGAAGS